MNEDFYDILQDAGELETTNLARQIAEATGATILERRDYMCQPVRKLCFGVSPELTKFFYDGGHHSLAGAKFFGYRIDQVKWLGPLLGE